MARRAGHKAWGESRARGARTRRDGTDRRRRRRRLRPCKTSARARRGRRSGEPASPASRGSNLPRPWGPVATAAAGAGVGRARRRARGFGRARSRRLSAATPRDPMGPARGRGRSCFSFAGFIVLVVAASLPQTSARLREHFDALSLDDLRPRPAPAADLRGVLRVLQPPVDAVLGGPSGLRDVPLRWEPVLPTTAQRALWAQCCPTSSPTVPNAWLPAARVRLVLHASSDPRDLGEVPPYMDLDLVGLLEGTHALEIFIECVARGEREVGTPGLPAPPPCVPRADVPRSALVSPSSSIPQLRCSGSRVSPVLARIGGVLHRRDGPRERHLPAGPGPPPRPRATGALYGAPPRPTSPFFRRN